MSKTRAGLGLAVLIFSVHREHRLVTCRSVNRGRGQGTSFFGASLVIPVGTCPADPLTLVLKPTEACP
ncbi:MAG: hypothetical protein P8020_15255 [Acidobacteriota bacterium]